MTDSNITLPDKIMTMSNMLKSSKNLLLILSFLLFAVSCEKNELDSGNFLDNLEEIDLVSNSRIVLPLNADSVTISFQAEMPWTASLVNERSEQWCSIFPTSGEAGEAFITVYTTENLGTDERSALIVLKTGGEKYKSVKVTQKQKDALTVTESVFEMTDESSEFTVEVKTNVDYNFTISESDMEKLNELNHICSTRPLRS